MAHHEPSHQDLCSLTFSLLTLHINYFQSIVKKKRNKADDKCCPKFGAERVKLVLLVQKLTLHSDAVPANIYLVCIGSSTSSHSETHIIKSTVMKQNKRLNGDLKPGYKKATNRTMSLTTDIDSQALTI